MWRSVPHKPPAIVFTSAWYGPGSGSGTSSSSRRPGSTTTAAFNEPNPNAPRLSRAVDEEFVCPRVDRGIDAGVDEPGGAGRQDDPQCVRQLLPGLGPVRGDAEPARDRSVVGVDEVDANQTVAVI